MNARTITLKELAEELGYDNTTISYAVKKGYLPKPEIKILSPGKGRSSYAWKRKDIKATDWYKKRYIKALRLKKEEGLQQKHKEPSMKDRLDELDSLVKNNEQLRDTLEARLEVTEHTISQLKAAWIVFMDMQEKIVLQRDRKNGR